MTLVETVAEKAAGGVGAGLKTAWKPFGWFAEKDQSAADWIAGQYIKQSMDQSAAMGLRGNERDQQLRQTFAQQGAGAMFRQGTEDQALVRFMLETMLAPSTLASLGAVAAPELAGKSAALAGIKAAPEIAPWVRGAISARSVPEAFRGATGLERLGMAAQGVDRFMGLPFEAALTVPRMARADSLARGVPGVRAGIPAFNYLLSHSSDTMAKIASRTVGNAVNAAEKAGVPLRRVLGMEEQGELPGMGGAPNPPGPNPSGTRPPTDPNGVYRMDLSGNAEWAARQEPGQAWDAQSRRPGQNSNPQQARIDELYQQWGQAQTEEEHQRIYNDITRLEGEVDAGDVAKATDPRQVQLNRIIAEMDRGVNDEQFNRLYDEAQQLQDEIDGVSPDAGAGPPLEVHPAEAAQPGSVIENAPAGESPIDVSAEQAAADAALQAQRDASLIGMADETTHESPLNDLYRRNQAEVLWARRGATGERGGNMNRIIGYLQSIKYPLHQLPADLRHLFGGVTPEGVGTRTGFGGSGHLGYARIGEIGKQITHLQDQVARMAENRGDPQWIAQAYGQIKKLQADRAREEVAYAVRVLGEQDEERLLDFLEWVDAWAWERNRIAKDDPLATGYGLLGSSKAVRERVRRARGVRDFSISGASEEAGPNPMDDVFQNVAGHQAPTSQFPDIDLNDHAIQQIQGYAPQLTRALEEYDRDVKAARHIVRTALGDHPDLAERVTTMRGAQDALRGIIPQDAYERLTKIFTRYDDMGLDLLVASEHQAVGTMAMIEVARELSPKLFKDRSAMQRFVTQVLPAMWKEQALLTPRYHLGNLLDIVGKSAMDGYVPLRKPNLTREGTRLHAGVPERVARLANNLGIHVPADITNSFRESLVGSRQAFLTGAREDSAYRSVWKRYNPVAFVTEANMELGTALETSARTAIWEQEVTRRLAQQGPEQVARMLSRLDIDPDVADSIIQMFMARQYRVDADLAGSFLRGRGVRERVVKDFQKHWRNMVDDISQEGVRASNKIHFDYADRSNLDRFVGWFIPFHFWASRNIPYYLEHLAENPALAAAWLRYDRIAEEERKQKHLPRKFSGFLMLGGEGIIGGLFGMPGMLAANPLMAMSITSQVNPGGGFEREDATGLGKALGKIHEYTGLGPGPHIDALLNVTGQYGSTPNDPNITRMGPALNAIGIPTPDNLLTRITNAARGVVTGEDTSSLTGSQMKDRQIRTRIMELAVEEGRGPNDSYYLQALNDPENPIWKKAEGQVKRQQGISNVIGAVVPIPTKFGTDTSIEIQGARDTTNALRDQITGGQEDLTPEQRKAVEQAVATMAPDDSKLADALTALGPLGAAPQIVELKRQAELFGQFTEQADRLPSKTKARLYEQWFERYPLFKAYLDWNSKQDVLETEIDPGTSYQRFLKEHNNQ